MRRSLKTAVKIRKGMEDLVYGRVVGAIMGLSQIGKNTITGKADAGTSIDCMYRGKAKGEYAIGRFIDGILLNLPAVKATIRKKDVIIKILQNEFSNNLLLGKKTKILDLASGPARYLVDFLDNSKYFGEEVEILCVDNDRASINFGKLIGKNKPIRFIKADTFKLGTLKKFSRKVGWKANVVICTGFFELNDDDSILTLLHEIHDSIEKDGLLLFTNQADNPSKKLMKKIGRTQNGGSWKMRFRDAEKLRKWLMDIGFRDVIISEDSWGMYEYCTGRKR
jgi:SAM-dependent methyltransferase